MTDKEIANFIKQTSCPFLAARKGYWIGADSVKEKYMKGKNFYREQAYNDLKRQEYTIKNGVFLQGEDYDVRYKQQIIDWASNACDRKLEELKNAMKMYN